MDTGWLATYLNNHLAGAAAGQELLRRAAAAGSGTATESFLRRLALDLEEEQALLVRLIRAAGGREETLRRFGAWALEKAGLLRLGDSGPDRRLERLVALEALLLGNVGRVGMWRLMESCFAGDRRFDFIDFAALRERGERHLQELERLRMEAARDLSGGR